MRMVPGGGFCPCWPDSPSSPSPSPSSSPAMMRSNSSGCWVISCVEREVHYRAGEKFGRFAEEWAGAPWGWIWWRL
jgi:hypothetical protein